MLPNLSDRDLDVLVNPYVDSGSSAGRFWFGTRCARTTQRIGSRHFDSHWQCECNQKCTTIKMGESVNNAPANQGIQSCAVQRVERRCVIDAGLLNTDNIRRYRLVAAPRGVLCHPNTEVGRNG